MTLAPESTNGMAPLSAHTCFMTCGTLCSSLSVGMKGPSRWLKKTGSPSCSTIWMWLWHLATTIGAFLGISISAYSSRSGYCSRTLDRMLRCCEDLTLLLVLTCSSTLKRLNMAEEWGDRAKVLAIEWASFGVGLATKYECHFKQYIVRLQIYC
jgi:hypothetical protein